MWKIALGAVNFLSSGTFQAIAGAVTGVIGKLSDNEAAEFAAATGAERDTLIARYQADSAAYQQRMNLMRGFWWLQWLLLLAYLGPVYHTLLVYLDSCPFLLGFTVHGWPAFLPHIVGSWKVAALPGMYSEHEWQTIAALLGIQTGSVGGFMYFLHKK